MLIDRNGQLVAESERGAISASLPLVVGPGAPAAAAALIDALTDRPELQKRVVAAVRVGERRWNLRLNNGADVMLPEGHEIAALDRLMPAAAGACAARSAACRRSTCACADRLVLRPHADTDAADAAHRRRSPRDRSDTMNHPSGA